MKIINNSNLRGEVDRLFNEAPDRFHSWRTNPVTGGRWVSGVDPIRPQKEAARRALEARARFADDGPPDAPPLPLSELERAELEGQGGVLRMIAWYARSLAGLDYDYDRHPAFEEYARGVMASPDAWASVRQDPELQRRFPPKPLAGLICGRIWQPPK